MTGCEHDGSIPALRDGAKDFRDGTHGE